MQSSVISKLTVNSILGLSQILPKIIIIKKIKRDSVQME